MTRCTFPRRQLIATVAEPLQPRSARFTPLARPWATPPINAPTATHQRLPPSPLQFRWPGLETLSSPGEF